MRIWGLTSLLSVLVLSASPGADGQCTQPRVRRAWTTLSTDERQLYKDAIAAAMDSGAYIKFVEIHTEMMSEMEAHRQCMFIYWHRLFLAAFENMLRGQGSRFACVTVPYWDWMTDYSGFFTNKCSNILECSPTLQFLGDRAPVNEAKRSVAINGVSISGYCEADYPMNHFCQSSQVTGDKCADCVPRGDWLRASFPASASFASVRAQLFQARNIGEMSKAIEQGVHNNIHAELDATMATFQSPSDPVFWSHHAMVDLLHSIFHKCKVGEQTMSFAQKAASVDWTSCERRSGGVFNPTDYVMMRSGYRGMNALNATRDPLVGPYFSALPQQYAALIDIRDLGTSSYSFELQGLAGTLYTQCGATSPPPTPAPTTTAPTPALITPAPAPTTTAPEPTFVPTEAPTTTPPTEAPTNTPTEAPTETPSFSPTQTLIAPPTWALPQIPTDAPTEAPTDTPTISPPTETPTDPPASVPATEPPTSAPVDPPTDLRPVAPAVASWTAVPPTETPTPSTDEETAAPTAAPIAAVTSIVSTDSPPPPLTTADVFDVYTEEPTPTPPSPTSTDVVRETNAPKPKAPPASALALLPEVPTSEVDDGSLDEGGSQSETETQTPTRPPARHLRVKRTAPPMPRPPPLGSMINTTMDPATSELGHWTNSVDKLTRREGGDPLVQAEEMTCLFQDECLGGVTTYSREFKLLFGVTEEPRCKQIVDRIRRWLSPSTLADWKAQMSKTFGCPRPKKMKYTSAP